MRTASQRARLDLTVRLVGAVIVGFVATILLTSVADALMRVSRIFPSPAQAMATELWILAALCRVVICIACCALTARLASDRPMRAAVVLAVVCFVPLAFGVWVTWSQGLGSGPNWYPILLLVAALPCAWLGGTLGRMWSARRAA